MKNLKSIVLSSLVIASSVLLSSCTTSKKSGCYYGETEINDKTNLPIAQENRDIACSTNTKVLIE